MRINPLGDGDLRSNKIEEKKKTSKKRKKGKGVEEKGGFFEILSDSEVNFLEKRLQELVDDIVEAGNDLARSPTLGNLERYRSKIREFLKLLEKRLYKISGKVDLETKKPKLHVVVEEINDRLEEIAKALFEAEKPTINIAAKVGEINGLILDIYE